ncbi:hypothetical protein [Sphingobium abikonense]|uniref:hypothetical protein n=1 Tax=Sphingobium abikonense TaxID=86193 RepID=UPI0035134424
MSMVETIARAMMWATGHDGLPILVLDPDFNELPDAAHMLDDDEYCREDVLALATAALRAMETPTEAMVEAGLTTGARFGPDAMRNIWRTMIRAAVAEGER